MPFSGAAGHSGLSLLSPGRRRGPRKPASDVRLCPCRTRLALCGEIIIAERSRNRKRRIRGLGFPGITGIDRQDGWPLRTTRSLRCRPRQSAREAIACVTKCRRGSGSGSGSPPVTYRPFAPQGTAAVAPPVARHPCPVEARPYVLAATIIASAMAFIDSTVVGIAVPAIQKDLSADIVAMQWVANAYAADARRADPGRRRPRRPGRPATLCSWPESSCSRSPRCSAPSRRPWKC